MINTTTTATANTNATAYGDAGGDDDDDDDDRASLPDRYRRGGRPPGNGRPQPRGMQGPQHSAHAAMYGRALSDDIDSD